MLESFTQEQIIVINHLIDSKLLDTRIAAERDKKAFQNQLALLEKRIETAGNSRRESLEEFRPQFSAEEPAIGQPRNQLKNSEINHLRHSTQAFHVAELETPLITPRTKKIFQDISSEIHQKERISVKISSAYDNIVGFKTIQEKDYVKKTEIPKNSKNLSGLFKQNIVEEINNILLDITVKKVEEKILAITNGFMVKIEFLEKKIEELEACIETETVELFERKCFSAERKKRINIFRNDLSEPREREDRGLMRIVNNLEREMIRSNENTKKYCDMLFKNVTDEKKMKILDAAEAYRAPLGAKSETQNLGSKGTSRKFFDLFQEKLGAGSSNSGSTSNNKENVSINIKTLKAEIIKESGVATEQRVNQAIQGVKTDINKFEQKVERQYMNLWEHLQVELAAKMNTNDKFFLNTLKGFEDNSQRLEKHEIKTEENINNLKSRILSMKQEWERGIKDIWESLGKNSS